MSFLTDVEAQAKQESERVIKELTQLKFDAQQVIHVLNALKLEVPKELRELSPIERVPLPMVAVPKELHQLFDTPKEKRREGSRKGGVAAGRSRQKKAAEREEEIRKAITDQLSKGPVLRTKLVDALPYPDSAINTIGTRMKKEGLLDYRVVGFQGPTEWFLPSCPVRLEQVRDASLKVRKQGLVYAAEVSPTDVAHELKIDSNLATDLMEELVEQGILTCPAASGIYTYEKPKGTSIKTAAEHQRTKNFGGGVNGISGDKISSNKEVRELVVKARNQGAVVNPTDKHISVSYAGHTAIIGKTPGVSGLKQDRNRLKMMGLRV